MRSEFRSQLLTGTGLTPGMAFCANSRLDDSSRAVVIFGILPEICAKPCVPDFALISRGTTRSQSMSATTTRQADDLLRGYRAGLRPVERSDYLDAACGE